MRQYIEDCRVRHTRKSNRKGGNVQNEVCDSKIRMEKNPMHTTRFWTLNPPDYNDQYLIIHSFM
jgi:hypothetical protein